MKALTVVLQMFNICSYMAWILDTMTLDLSDTGLWGGKNIFRLIERPNKITESMVYFLYLD